MEVTLLFALILLNGAFAMSDIALVTARKGRMQRLANEGAHGAAAAVRLGEDPTRFLSTIQIGITAPPRPSAAVSRCTLGKRDEDRGIVFHP
jgi:putative hemolysin